MTKNTIVLALSCAVASSLHAGPLTEARVNKIINDVRVVHPSQGARPAVLQDTIKDDLAVRTGVKSRSELLFQDQTLTRLGPETSFSFKAGTREMALDQGTLLLQVPKGLGGAKIRTAAVTAAITGTTIMMEYRPKQSIKVLVLEGSLRLSVNGRFGDSLLLTPGKMVIMPPDARRIPDPVSVDLAKVTKTSSLVKMGNKKGDSLPSMDLIEQEIEVQAKEKSGEKLIETNLVIDGAGTDVVLASADTLNALGRRDAGSSMQTIANPLPTPGATPLPTPGTTSPATGPGATPTPNLVTGTPSPTATPATTATPGSSPTPGPTATPSTSPTPNPSPSATPADHEYDQVMHLRDDDDDDLTVDHPIDLSTNGRTAKVTMTADEEIKVKTMVKVSTASGPTPSRFGGRIDVRSNRTRETAISLNSSAQLLSLLAASAPGPGGAITFQSAGGEIKVDGSRVQADRGLIDIQNNGASGRITLHNATLNASTVKARALGTNGQLNIGGGSITADTAIYLFAGGSNGTVNFTDNVTLSGTSVKTIVGNTVTIRDGKVVTISGVGPASVFANNPNYTGSGGNSSTTGRFGGQGATTAPLTAAPQPGR